MNEHSRGPQLLQDNAGKLKTRMGGCFLGERAVFRGHDLHTELKDMDWIELYVFGITGRRISAEQLRLMHALWVYTSYPDARIWNNRVAALSGTARSTGNLGLSAALAVSEAWIYGRGNDIRAIDFFIRACKKLESGSTLADCIAEEVKTYGRIAGYGRPLAAADERIEPIMLLARNLGLADGPHVRLAYMIEEFLLASRWRLRMNYGGLYCALGADLGFSAREFYLFMFPSFLAGMTPCVIEATQRPAGTLFPLSCTDIFYEGPPKRPFR